MNKLVTCCLIILSLTVFSQSSNYDLLIKSGLDKYNKGLNQQALEDFEKAHAFDSTRVEAYYYTGITLAANCHQSGKLCNEAIEMLSIAINVNPNFRKSFYNRGVCFLRLNMFKQAIADFDKAIKVDSTNGEAYANRGVAKINIGQKSEGCQDIDKAINLKSNQAIELKKLYCQ